MVENIIIKLWQQKVHTFKIYCWAWHQFYCSPSPMKIWIFRAQKHKASKFRFLHLFVRISEKIALFIYKMLGIWDNFWAENILEIEGIKFSLTRTLKLKTSRGSSFLPTATNQQIKFSKKKIYYCMMKKRAIFKPKKPKKNTLVKINGACWKNHAWIYYYTYRNVPVIQKKISKMDNKKYMIVKKLTYFTIENIITQLNAKSCMYTYQVWK